MRCKLSVESNYEKLVEGFVEKINGLKDLLSGNDVKNLVSIQDIERQGKINLNEEVEPERWQLFSDFFSDLVIQSIDDLDYESKRAAVLNVVVQWQKYLNYENIRSEILEEINNADSHQNALLFVENITRIANEYKVFVPSEDVLSKTVEMFLTTNANIFNTLFEEGSKKRFFMFVTEQRKV